MKVFLNYSKIKITSTRNLERTRHGVIRSTYTCPWRFQRRLRCIKTKFNILSKIFSIKIACDALFVCFPKSTFSPISVRCLFISLRELSDHIGTALPSKVLPCLEITETGEPIFKSFGSPKHFGIKLSNYTAVEPQTPHFQTSKLRWAAHMLQILFSVWNTA